MSNLLEKKNSQTIYPLVSVLVPAYNQRSYIQACLDSILEDGYPNLEVIVLDDGSVDNTYDVAQKWFEDNGTDLYRYRLIRQDNHGITKTLNKMLRMFSGEYFILLAADDVLLNGGILERLSVLQVMPEALAIFADAIGIDESGEKIYNSVLTDKYHASIRALLNTHTRAYELILNWCVPGPVFLAKREILQEIGYYNEKYFIEDRDYYLRLVANNKLAFTSAKVAAYRIHGEASTGTLHKQIRVGKEVMRIEGDLLPLFHGVKRIALWLTIRSNGINYRLVKDFDLIIEFLKVALTRVATKGLKFVIRLIAFIDKA